MPSLIKELYDFLKQSDARELRHLFTTLDKAKASGDVLTFQRTQDAHACPIVLE